MPNHFNHKKFAVLYVDDEEKSLVNFTRAFGDDFTVLTVNNAAGAFQLVQQRATWLPRAESSWLLDAGLLEAALGMWPKPA